MKNENNYFHKICVGNGERMYRKLLDRCLFISIAYTVGS